jgi:hypothetical protein
LAVKTPPDPKPGSPGEPNEVSPATGIGPVCAVVFGIVEAPQPTVTVIVPFGVTG